LTINRTNIFDRLFIVVVIFSVLAPNFNAIDNNAIRWTFLSISSIIYLLYNLINFSSFYLFSKKTLLIIVSLIMLLTISSVSSINLNESIITSSKILITLITLICMINSISKIKNAILFIAKIFAFSIFVESCFTIISFFENEIINFTGISMNRNISAFSIALKIPLIIYLRQEINNLQTKKLIFLLEILSITTIIILQSRGALLSIILMYLFLLVKTSWRRKIIIPLIFTIVGSYVYIKNFASLYNQKVINPLALVGDQSFTQRLNYYDTALQLFQEKPFFGHGIGTWKIKSLELLDFGESSLIAPYYVHNDFLQFLVELGLIGLLLYISIFFFLFFLIHKKFQKRETIIPIIQVSLLIFLLDSNINFPIHRSQELIPFLLICSVILSRQPKESYRASKYLFILLIPLLLFCGYLSIKENESLIIQDKFISDYYSQSFEIDLQELDDVNYKLPNLSANTVPIATYIARYYLDNYELDKAEDLLDYSITANPFDIFTKELLLSLNLQKLKYFKAYEVSEELFIKDNDNEVYADIYFFTSTKVNSANDLLTLDIIQKSDNINIHKLFYKNLKQAENVDKTKLAELILLSILKFPNEIYFKNVFTELVK